MSSKEPDLSPDWREKRRFQAWELHEQGWTQRKIAAALGVTQGAVCQWLKKAREGGGVNALRPHPAPGRRSALNPTHLEQLALVLSQGAEAYGFEGNHWTTKRVTEVIKQIFGVSYHPAHVSRVLRRYYPEWRETRKT